MNRKILNVGIGVNIAINAALAVPPVALAFRQWRLRQGNHPEKDRADYPLGVFRKHAVALATHHTGGLLDADILEIGPGGNVGSSLLMLLAGARSMTCIDYLPWVPATQTEALYVEIVTAAAREPETYFVAPAWRAQARVHPAEVARTLLKQIHYLAPENINTTTLPDASFDGIFSHACFEHFADPATSIRQIARLLRPGGATSHQIDLRDHRDFDRPLGHLKYRERVWWWANARLPNGVRNRWRTSEYVAAFAAAGLPVVAQEATRTHPITEAQRARLHPHFRAMLLEDLSVTSVFLVATKPINVTNGI